LLFEERRPFKFKKEFPSEQWQIISFRLIPLKTPVSFSWTVHLICLSEAYLRLFDEKTNGQKPFDSNSERDSLKKKFDICLE
jgi:hypothetical protein